MNDRFKFRVWDTDIKEYLVGEFLVGGCGDMIHNVVDCESFLNKGNYIIEQSTGLKDKNGNLIYEGDLIKSPNNSYMLEVVRMPNGVYGCKVCKISPVWEMNLYSLINAYDVEIIGNIHEQPEQKDK